MNKEQYYDVIRALVPSYGEMPLSFKKEIINVLRNSPNTRLEPATDNEIGAVLNYLNHTCMEVDMMCGKNGFVRFKDAVLCINYEQTEWILLERRPDEQLWDLWNYVVNLENDEQFEKDMSNIYTIKS